ncbi:MAG TPA: septation protein SepH [Humibacillus sp.]|nr:septation protein SepH [Humibacillus sp.]
MQDLTLIGVHEDGLHLLLADAEGNRYTVPLDDSLRAAARRDRPRLGQLQNELTGGLRPAAVQSMIRAGLTAEEAAERAGWTVEKVHKYEGPILAEREHVAGLARQVRLRSRGGSHGASTTLEARVTERLVSREIDPTAVSWDSRRADKGEWIVSLAFAAGGREREAAWRFDPLARIVAALDDESRWLSEDDDTPAPGPLPAPHLATPTRPAKVYDVEAEGGVGASSGRARSGRPTASARTATARSASEAPAAPTTTGAAPDDSPDGGQPVDLVAAMRQRNAQRGRRRRPRGADVPGLDEAPEEALPLEDLALDPRDHVPPPAQHPHPDDEDLTGADALDAGDLDDTDEAEAAPSAEADPGAAGASEVEPEPQPERNAPPKPGPRPRRTDRTQPVRQTQAGRSTPPAAAAGSQPDVEHDDEGDELIEEQVAAPAATPKRPAAGRPAPRKNGRPSVPSWDDIMFGRKGD